MCERPAPREGRTFVARSENATTNDEHAADSASDSGSWSSAQSANWSYRLDRGSTQSYPSRSCAGARPEVYFDGSFVLTAQTGQAYQVLVTGATGYVAHRSNGTTASRLLGRIGRRSIRK